MAKVTTTIRVVYTGNLSVHKGEDGDKINEMENHQP